MDAVDLAIAWAVVLLIALGLVIMYLKTGRTVIWLIIAMVVVTAPLLLHYLTGDPSTANYTGIGSLLAVLMLIALHFQRQHAAAAAALKTSAA
jgi:hypothetical protein